MGSATLTMAQVGEPNCIISFWFSDGGSWPVPLILNFSASERMCCIGPGSNPGRGFVVGPDVKMESK